MSSNNTTTDDHIGDVTTTNNNNDETDDDNDFSDPDEHDVIWDNDEDAGWSDDAYVGKPTDYSRLSPAPQPGRQRNKRKVNSNDNPMADWNSEDNNNNNNNETPMMVSTCMIKTGIPEPGAIPNTNTGTTGTNDGGEISDNDAEVDDLDELSRDPMFRAQLEQLRLEELNGGNNNNNNNNYEYEGCTTKEQPDTQGALKRDRCYICFTCDSVNRLLDSMVKHNFQCVNECGGGGYDPKTANIVYSAYYVKDPYEDMDEKEAANKRREKQKKQNNNNGNDIAALPDAYFNVELQSYEVWVCPQCEHINSILWRYCVLDHCRFERAILNVVTTYFDKEPINPIKSIWKQEQPVQQDPLPDSHNPNHNNNSNNNRIPGSNYMGLRDVNNASSEYNPDAFGSQKERRLRKKEHLMGNFGVSRSFSQYPVTSEPCWTKSHPSLINKIGLPYTNLYHSWTSGARFFGFENSNDENSNVNIYKYDKITMKFKDKSHTNNSSKNANNSTNDNNSELAVTNTLRSRLESARNIALNRVTGWMAIIYLDIKTNLPFLYVLKCRNSFEYEIVCEYNLDLIFGDFINQVRNANSSIQIPEIDEILPMTRVRFIDNDIYLFCWAQSAKVLYQFKVGSDDDNISGKYEISHYNSFTDRYWVKSQVMDIDILHEPNLIVILFDRWVGYYSFEPNDSQRDMEWFHACAFFDLVKGHSVDCHTFECISYDHTNEDNLLTCENTIAKTNEIVNNVTNLRNKDDTKNSNNNSNNNNYSQINYSKVPNSRGMIKSDYSVHCQRVERLSHRFYNYINCENELIAHHPSNSSWDYVRCATDIAPGRCLYAVSKIFGTFFTNREQNCVLWCNNRKTYKTFVEIFKFTNEHKHTKINYMGYDESFGLSGRLLIHCENVKDNEYFMTSLTSSDDLTQLSVSITKYESTQFDDDADYSEYNRLIARIHTYIYEYAYGSEFIAQYFDNDLLYKIVDLNFKPAKITLM